MATIMRILITTIFLLSIGLTTPLQAASSYSWTDDNGNVIYSQQPPRDNRPYKRITGLQKSTVTPVEDAESKPAEKQKPKETGYSEEDIARRDAHNAENCKRAKEALDFYTANKRYKDKDGKIKKVSDDERQESIEKAEKGIEDFCN